MIHGCTAVECLVILVIPTLFPGIEFQRLFSKYSLVDKSLMKINKKRETTADLRHADDIMGVTIDTPKCVSVYKKHQG